MQTAGFLAFGQGSVGLTAQAVGVDAGQWNEGVTIKAMAGNGGKLYVGATISTAGLSAWSGGATYAKGQRVTNGNNVYQCQVGGIAAGSGGPTGNGQAIIDGGVTWAFVGIGVVTPQNGYQLNVGDSALFRWSNQDSTSLDAQTLSIVSDTTGPNKYCWSAN